MRGLIPIVFVGLGIAAMNYGDKQLPCGWRNADRAEVVELVQDVLQGQPTRNSACVAGPRITFERNHHRTCCSAHRVTSGDAQVEVLFFEAKDAPARPNRKRIRHRVSVRRR